MNAVQGLQSRHCHQELVIKVSKRGSYDLPCQSETTTAFAQLWSTLQLCNHGHLEQSGCWSASMRHCCFHHKDGDTLRICHCGKSADCDGRATKTHWHMFTSNTRAILPKQRKGIRKCHPVKYITPLLCLCFQKGITSLSKTGSHWLWTTNCHSSSVSKSPFMDT